MNHKKPLEKGQAIIVMMLGIVVLLGFTALAIDGGMVYSQRRAAQNAADAAALAGALQKVNNNDDTAADNAIVNSVRGNGYQDAQITNKQISGPFYDPFGYYYLATVELSIQYQTSFASFIWNKTVTNHVTAIARAKPSQPTMNGYAIVSLGDCTVTGDPNLSIAGGGKRGSIQSFDGDIFINSPEDCCPCSMNPSNSKNSIGIEAYNVPGEAIKFHIRSVGSWDWMPEEKIAPLPVITNQNEGEPIGDPLQGLPEPTCSGNADTSGSYKDPISGLAYDIGPGNIEGSTLSGLAKGKGGVTLGPGIYCVNGGIHVSGQGGIDGSSGVVIYMKNGSITFTGKAGDGGLSITAPSAATCSGQACDYINMAIFSSRNNTNDIEVRGNGELGIVGLVYALKGTVGARGGGNKGDDLVIHGQLICDTVDNRGNGQVKVIYDNNLTFWRPPLLSLER